MEEHSSQQSLSCLLPQHTHTSPYPVGVQVSGAALKGPQSLPNGKLTAVGKDDTQSHKNTCTHKHTRPRYLSTQTNPNGIMHMHKYTIHILLTLSDAHTLLTTTATSREQNRAVILSLKPKHCHFDEQLHIFNIQTKHSLQLCLLL